MTSEERQALLELVKKLGAFAADRRAFITILEELNVKNWQERLEELRKTPQYQLIALRYEEIFRRMEVEADFEALARMIQQIDEGKPPN